MRMTENVTVGIIDMQNCFADPKNGTLPVDGTEKEIELYGGIDKVIDNIEKFVDTHCMARYFFTTEDKHPKGHSEFDVFPEHALMDTADALYVPKLRDAYRRANTNIVKGLDWALLSYSVATSVEFGDHINNLRSRNIDTIVLVGVAYNFCVGESAIDYARQGFDVYVVRDLTLSVSAIGTEIMDKKLSLYGVKTILSKDIQQ